MFLGFITVLIRDMIFKRVEGEHLNIIRRAGTYCQRNRREDLK